MGGTPTPLPVPNPGPAASTPGPHPGPEPGPSGLGEYPKEPVFGKDAVCEAMAWNAAIQSLRGFAIDAKWDREELTVTVPREQIVAACQAVKAAEFTFMEDVTAVDWYPQEPRIQVTYHILSQKLKQRVRIAVLLSSEALELDSITSIWPSANFYEREVFDLFGVTFHGHPGLKRIMMPDNWKGHPLRKDYPVEGYR